MKGKEKLRPGFLASESFFPLLSDEKRLFAALGQVFEDGFYSRLEISAQKTPEGRRELRRLAEQVPVTQWITNDLNSLGLNPSTVDPGLRKKTTEKMRELVDIAAESGADRIAFISCQDPGEALRAEATKGLAEVICTVAQDARRSGITLLLEPLDRGAHKNNLIGPTNEAVALLEQVHRSAKNVLLSWDSAHVALNGENVTRSLSDAFPYVGQIHLANAILDRQSPDFGDWHMARGTPGFLTAEAAASIAACAIHRLPGEEIMGITVECRSASEDVMWKNIENNRAFISAVLEQEVS